MYSLLTETVVTSLSAADFHVADLLTSARPVTIYLQWPERDILALQSLMKLMWGTFIDILRTTYDASYVRNAHHTLHKVLLMIDEGGVTPIPELYHHVSTVNGRGISFMIAVQALSQLDALYGKSNAETILNNCSKVFFYQESLSTAKYVSECLQYKSGFASSENERHGETSRGSSEQRVPLLNPREIMDMPDDDILIFTRGYKPIQAHRLKPSVVPSPLRLPLPALPAGETLAFAPAASGLLFERGRRATRG